MLRDGPADRHAGRGIRVPVARPGGRAEEAFEQVLERTRLARIQEAQCHHGGAGNGRAHGRMHVPGFADLRRNRRIVLRDAHDRVTPDRDRCGRAVRNHHAPRHAVPVHGRIALPELDGVRAVQAPVDAGDRRLRAGRHGERQHGQDVVPRQRVAEMPGTHDFLL